VLDILLAVISGGSEGSVYLAYVSLFLGTFVQEGLAIAAGAALIVEQGLPPLLVATSLIVGMVTGDLVIYGLGVLARRHQWVRRLAGDMRIAEATEWLHCNLIGMVVLSRVVPGVLFPTFLAYGLSGLPFLRFAALSMISAGLYGALWLSVLVTFGQAAIPALGRWTWVGIAVAAILSITLATRLATRQLRASLRS
jgi:membrane protein DedA with SNARE-associated domain